MNTPLMALGGLNNMESNTEKQSLEGHELTVASSRPDIFPFEKLPAELRVKVYEYVLISPCGWFNITWNGLARFRISLTEDLSRTELLGKMCVSMIYLNKSIHQEACKVLYGSNLFHFDFPIAIGCYRYESPYYDHNVVAFLSAISKSSRRVIRSIRIYAGAQRLEQVSIGDGWPSLCRYLASSKVHLTHLALAIVNDCTLPEHDIVDMRKLCKIESPWVRYLTRIKGLKSFTLHTSRCPCLYIPFEGRDRCPTTLPLASEVVRSFNQTHEWTAEDRTNGLVIKDGFIEVSKNTMIRHIQRHHVSPFYGEILGA